MGKVITQASMSLDGYIAELSDNVGPLFDWSTTGDVEVTGSDPNMVFRVSAPSAKYLSEVWANIRASVIGRRLFDLAGTDLERAAPPADDSPSSPRRRGWG